MSRLPEISIVSPVYQAGAILEELLKRLNDSLGKITSNYEIILVNDGSNDNSWEEIVRLSADDKRIKGYNLSKNFGQHQAIYCGLSMSRGKYTIVIDCDLQDNPVYI